jgi:hypothetical protein
VKAGDDEEHIYANVPTLKAWNLSMEQENGDDRNRSQAFDIRTVSCANDQRIG